MPILADACACRATTFAARSWHRASAGVPPHLSARVAKRLRVPLFVCMLALEAPVRRAGPHLRHSCV
eukprot:2008567-Pleurochrysis_carterae.AAC.5